MALHGVDAVSLRTITAEAGLTTAALHYHFDSRDDLVNAVLERRSSGMRAIDAFAEIEAGRRPLSAKELVLSVLTPWTELLREQPERGPLYLRLYSQLLASRDPRIQRSMVIDQFRRLMVQLPEPASSPVRWGIAINCLVHEMAAIAELELGTSDFDAHVAELVDFVVTGLGGDR
jgi:AcrR family transcriptional regulator